MVRLWQMQCKHAVQPGAQELRRRIVCATLYPFDLSRRRPYREACTPTAPGRHEAARNSSCKMRLGCCSPADQHRSALTHSPRQTACSPQ